MTSHRIGFIVGIMFTVSASFGMFEREAHAGNYARKNFCHFKWHHTHGSAGHPSHRFAKRRGHSHAYGHDYSHEGNVYGLPFGAKKIFAGNDSYYHYNGTFYKKCSRWGYDIVPPPLGAKIRRLPFGVKVRYRHGKKYFMDNGTFYEQADSGYVIISDPIRDTYAHCSRCLKD